MIVNHLKKIPVKPADPGERNSLLTIIAALCKEVKIDASKPYAAAKNILILIKIMGESLAENTIVGHLKQIPEDLNGAADQCRGPESPQALPRELQADRE